jgi:hypothetical protein
MGTPLRPLMARVVARLVVQDMHPRLIARPYGEGPDLLIVLRDKAEKLTPNMKPCYLTLTP